MWQFQVLINGEKENSHVINTLGDGGWGDKYDGGMEIIKQY